MNYYPILKREIHSYFVSPIFYGVLVIFLILSGYFFYTDLTFYNMINIRGMANPIEGFLRRYFNDLRFVLMILVPLITMRLLAEEKKLGTFELLAVNPVRDIEILFGKYLASLLVFVFMMSITVINIVFLNFIWSYKALQPLIPSILSGYLGLLLLGCSLIACGLFVSALTENQAVAGMVTMGIFILFWFLTWNEMMVDENYMQVLIRFSLFDRIQDFFKGIIQLNDIVYFILFTFFFLFLTHRILCSRIWRGQR